MICLTIAFVLSEGGQNWLSRQVVNRFSRELQTKISIDKVSITPFNKMHLKGVYLEDQKRDTLLYAGTVVVRITDWFFLKDKADLKYIGLENAVININRTDSVWNYHFLENYFSTPSSPGKKESGVSFHLQKIDLVNVRFNKQDAWLGNNTTASVAAMSVDVKDLGISEQKIAINDVRMVRPFFHIYDYPGKHTSTSSSDDNWNIAINNIALENGRFRLDNDSLYPSVSYFDTEHLNFSDITGKAKDFRLRNDVITAHIDLTALERSGLQVKKLQTDFKYTPQAIVFDDLLLKTNRSTIKNYFAMRFDGAADLKKFFTRVQLEGHFNNSYISSDDLAFFSPDLKSWNKNIRIDGNVSGTVSSLHSSNLELWAGNTAHFKGAVNIIGLPDIDKTYLDIQATDLRATYGDLVNFVPDLKNVRTPDLRKLGYVQFSGSHKGTFDDFTTSGTFHTNLGNITTNLSMKLPARGLPKYSGTVVTSGFQLGSFLNNPDLGVIAFNGKINGAGFDWPSMNLAVNGRVDKFRYRDYVYQNIRVDGTIARQKFNGNLNINDPNADLQLTGLIDLSGKVPVFDARANVTYANLQPLQLSKEDIIVKGIFDADISGNSLSNLLGTARVSDAVIIHEGERLNFDSLYVFSGYEDGIKTLKAVSNEFDVAVQGNFDIAGLPDAFTLFLSRYYPSYIRKPGQVKNQDFTFNIKTGDVDTYLRLIDPNLGGLNNSEISGSLDTRNSTMDVNADVPFFSYKDYEFSDIRITGKGDLEKLELTGQVLQATIDSNFILPATDFIIVARDDVSDINIETSSNKPVSEASLAARVTTTADGFSVDVKPSTFVLNGKTWKIEEGGELIFRKNNIVHGEMVLRESQQEIVVRSIPSSIGNWNDIHVTVQNLNLNDLSPLLLPKNRLEGSLTGEIVIEDPENKFYVNANITVDQLKLDNDSLGRVLAVLNYNKKTGLITGKGYNADPDHNISFDVALNLANPANDRISLHLKNFQLEFLERFLGEIFTDMQGFVTGNLDITKHAGHQDFTGRFQLRDASMKVVFTQVTYKIEDTTIELKQDFIDLNGIRIIDTRGNTARVNGGIRHNGFAAMDYDIAVETISPNLELLNTTYKDNQLFYGRAYGSGSFVLIGPDYDMNMFIDMRASDIDSSWITLPPAKTRETGEANFMVERKYGEEMDPANMRGGRVNLTYDVNVTATPMLNVAVILDELTGDYIKGRGTGRLNIHSGTSVPLTINGRYNIDEGNYLFTFQSVFKKPFVLRKGANNYIEWTRDPYDARVNIEAVYTAERVSFAPLASTLLVNPSQSKSLAQLRDNVNVVAKMTGLLFEPKFEFSLSFPSNSGVYNNPAVVFGIQQIENNPNELYKQVTYLIVTNSFAPYGTSESFGRPLEEFTFNTVSGLFFNVINRELNQIFSRIFRNNRFTFNFSGSLYNRNLIDPNAKGIRLFNQVASNVSIGTSLFNERAIFTVGGTFDVPLENNVQQNFQLLPDVTLEILLNKTGSVRATFFYRQNVDFLYGSTTSGSPTTKRFGAGLSYNREFDSFSEFLFGRKNKPVVADTSAAVNTTPADSTFASQ